MIITAILAFVILGYVFNIAVAVALLRRRERLNPRVEKMQMHIEIDSADADRELVRLEKQIEATCAAMTKAERVAGTTMFRGRGVTENES